jgi:signal transduction histidine kinase
MTTAAKSPRILYVDDERANRVVFEASMKGEFDVTVADSGDKALQLMADGDFAVLITDMRMPGMEGDTLLRIVKERHPTVIRMVITAHQDVGPILRAVNEGLVARYIIKPFDRPELVQLLRWACEAWAFGKDSAALQTRLMETERLATLGSIAGLLVHDLRQPLMSQLVNIEHVGELLKDSPAIREAIDASSLSEDVKERIITILGDLPATLADLQHSTMHLSEMINGLRDLGRPRVVGPSGPPPFDPLPIIRNAMAVCQEIAMKSRASISYLGPKDLPQVRINRTELMQVLINVVSNAAQAVAARGEPNGRVQIEAYTTHDGLEIQVKDTGIGMDPETLAKVGTPFFTTRKEGTGLGIAQCQRLIGDAGGRFRIESKRGEGSTVFVTLPIVR